ncbi:AraC family transcriptional regulator [Nocardia transvalensis]|uniref:AraC family transcriptional regulator n=1 Tax=Nocardia transvalensis TaxID=37333 RepID=UPI0018963B62|nr:AraC family transcriptional regulator [Nocardia transvalensis]MBF6326979.1 AraC family transcriptional regulator [Nocardia transvalensis]
MDVFDELLRGVRGRGVLFGRSELRPPCALTLGEGASLTLCVPMRGDGWIVPQSGAPHHIRVGEAAVVCGPAPFVFTDDPGDGRATEAAGEAVLLAGTYHMAEQVPRRLLQVLPPVLVVPDEHDCAAMRDYLEWQLDASRPGRQVVLDRLLDWMLVCTLRDWFDRPEAETPGWYRALGDDVVGPALRAIHEDPSHPWTLAELSSRAGVSRTTFTTRFTELIGAGPVAYLTEWRMTKAADLLTGTDLTIAAIAHRVGYADAFGFSAAFKRIQGTSPSDYRRAATGRATLEAQPAAAT